jgi:hypothetical protein
MPELVTALLTAGQLTEAADTRSQAQGAASTVATPAVVASMAVAEADSTAVVVAADSMAAAVVVPTAAVDIGKLTAIQN